MVQLTCYLYKRARVSGSNWKKRWFVFDKDDINDTCTISYYAKSSNQHKAPKGTITLQHSHHTSRVCHTTADKSFALEIVPGDDSPPLVVAAEDAGQRKELLSFLTPFVHETASGYLYKQSGNDWKRRLFVVDFTDSVLRLQHKQKGVNANETYVFDANSRVLDSNLRTNCLELVWKLLGTC